MGGRRIDDHSSWVGSAPRGQVYPNGAKVKHEFSADGSGEVMRYEDTTEAIRDVQQQGNRKIKSQPMKPGHRY